MELNLAGKRALVTGSSGGIGEAIAIALAREGAIVAVHGRRPGGVEATCRHIRSERGRRLP